MTAWTWVRHAGFLSPFYWRKLDRAPPTSLRRFRPWLGEQEASEAGGIAHHETTALLAGNFTFFGETHRLGEKNRRWLPKNSSPAWQSELHAFGWLYGLRAVNTPPALDRARNLVGRWIDAHGSWHPIVWRPDCTGRRLVAWLQAADILLTSPTEPLYAALLASLGRQGRYLIDAAPMAAAGLPRVQAFAGLAFATLSLPFPPDFAAAAEKTLHRLSETLLTEDLRPDGGVLERCPSVQMRACESLLAVRAAYEEAQIAPPAGLNLALDRMFPMVRFFCLGDGALALFNGGQEESASRLDAILDCAKGILKIPEGAPHTGFQRLERAQTIALIDCGSNLAHRPAQIGAPRLYPLGGAPHAGPLSLEVSDGDERLIVNCGALWATEGAWRSAQRATAAHSTLCLNDRASGEFNAEGQMTRGATHVTVLREENSEGIWLDLSHDAYLGPFGLIVQRRLFLAADGGDLRGEDRLAPGGNAMGYGVAPFVVRFHLHPNVQVQKIDDHSAVLLRSARGRAWRFRAMGASVGIADSIYLGSGVEPCRCQQITLAGETAGAGAIVKWALRRETG